MTPPNPFPIDRQEADMNAEPVLVDQRERVLLVTINRPEARNAVNRAVADAIEAALDRLEAEDGLSLGVLTGAGGGFCAGQDLKALVAGEVGVSEERGFGGIARRPPTKPIIAAVEGFALAGGCEIALACDLIVAAEDARFGIPEVKRGLVAAGGGLRRLPQRLPLGLAKELALTGEPIDARRALELGLVNRVTPSGEALAGALALAEEIAANAPLALAASKRIIDAQGDWDDDEFWAKQGELAAAAMGSEDAIEGATAFAEKREPVWKGR
jgi:enoyl-CoA hydratase